MSNKRLHVLIDDEQSIKWLNAQTNMSASVRLLIEQVANGAVNHEDYVMFCAKQAPSPFGNNPSEKSKQNEIDKPKKIDVVENNEFEQSIETNETKVEDEPIEEFEDIVEIDEPEVIVEEPASSKQKQSVEPNVPNSADELTEDDWEKREERSQSAINNMLSDLKNKRT